MTNSSAKLYLLKSLSSTVYNFKLKFAFESNLLNFSQLTENCVNYCTIHTLKVVEVPFACCLITNWLSTLAHTNLYTYIYAGVQQQAVVCT